LNNLTGETKSWENLGKWFSNLNNQPNNLSDKTKVDLAAIKSGSLNREDLIRKVYEYMQSKTRYVSIQMGIGGLKPFDASVVDKYGYGDCKDHGR
jgi:transglutaminase-like putative cysteine protease